MLLGNEEQPVIIAKGANNTETKIFDKTKWHSIVNI